MGEQIAAGNRPASNSLATAGKARFRSAGVNPATGAAFGTRASAHACPAPLENNKNPHQTNCLQTFKLLPTL